jgi:hypothetical protein
MRESSCLQPCASVLQTPGSASSVPLNYVLPSLCLGNTCTSGHAHLANCALPKHQVAVRILWRHPSVEHHSPRTRYREQIAVPRWRRGVVIRTPRRTSWWGGFRADTGHTSSNPHEPGRGGQSGEARLDGRQPSGQQMPQEVSSATRVLCVLPRHFSRDRMVCQRESAVLRPAPPAPSP